MRDDKPPLINWLIPYRDGCIITVKVTPRSSRSQIVGIETGWLRVRLQAPPVDGKANVALIALLAKTLNISKSSITLLSGDTARVKRVQLQGLTPANAHVHVLTACGPVACDLPATKDA